MGEDAMVPTSDVELRSRERYCLARTPPAAFPSSACADDMACVTLQLKHRRQVHHAQAPR